MDHSNLNHGFIILSYAIIIFNASNELSVQGNSQASLAQHLKAVSS
jgi:hypothetical protein